MQDLIFKTRTGTEVNLTEIDMQSISHYFKVQSMADFIRENYPELPEVSIQKVSYETIEIIDDSFSGEDESNAIKKAFEKEGIKYHGIKY